jgi:hypothetical protein
MGIKRGRSIYPQSAIHYPKLRDCRWPDSNRHGPFTAQRILSPLRLPFRHIGAALSILSFYAHDENEFRNEAGASKRLEGILNFDSKSPKSPTHRVTLLNSAAFAELECVIRQVKAHGGLTTPPR